MAPTKKTNAPAFGEILAGLDAGPAERASPSRASGGRPSMDRASADRTPKTTSGIDVSWIETAQARARAAQMAHQAATAAAVLEKAAEPEQPEKAVEPENGSNSPRSPRRHFGGMAWSRRGPSMTQPSSYAQELNGQDGLGSQPADVAAQVEQPAQNIDAASAAAAPRANPVHRLWGLLRRLPWSWWRLEAVEARKSDRPAAAEAAPSPYLKTAATPKSEDEAIARELGLRADLAVVELRHIRREFAKKNHPDRIEPALRVDAARRMTIANMLIDAQMKQKSAPKS